MGGRSWEAAELQPPLGLGACSQLGKLDEASSEAGAVAAPLPDVSGCRAPVPGGLHDLLGTRAWPTGRHVRKSWENA